MKFRNILTASIVSLLPFAALAGTQPPPAGYTASQLLYEDQFTSPTLKTTMWNPWLGDDQWGRWGDQGKLASPYSGSNCDSTCSATLQVMYYDPFPYGYGTKINGNHLVGGNGNLSLIGNADTHFSNLGYKWASAAVTTYGKAYLPATGGYVQFHAKMPDSRYGGWAGLWLLSTGGAELDLQESGYTKGGSGNPNNMLAMNWHGGGSQNIQDTGIDLSAAYHTYGVEYRPGQSWKIYLDGQLKATYTQGVPKSAYQVLIDLEIAGPNAAGWHTVIDSTHPGPIQLDVDNVQIYSLSAVTPPPPPTDTTAPSVPGGLATTNTLPTEVDLSWTASTDNVGVTGYKISRNGTALGTSATTTYADKTAIASTTYSYTITANDAAGNTSAPSAAVSATTPAAPVFALGAAVATSGSPAVMSRAGRGSTICTQPAAVNGTILSGPQTIKTVVWWYVGFVSGCSGWVAQPGLILN